MNNLQHVVGYDYHRDYPGSLNIEPENQKYLTDVITDAAENLIKNRNTSKPLFLEIAHLAGHSNGNINAERLEVRDSNKVNETFHYIKNDLNRRKYAGINTFWRLADIFSTNKIFLNF